MPNAARNIIALRTSEAIPRLKDAGWANLEFLNDGIRLWHGKKSVFLTYANIGCDLLHKHEVEAALDLIRVRTQ